MNEFEKVALLIDADNTQASKTEDIIREVSTYGRIVIKRAYGNWSKKNLAPWEKEIKRFAISAIQQFDFAAGKNASDMALTIDAMELLYSGKYDCFVLVSSDSDFTSLAIKLHEAGVYVVGYGNKSTVESFRNACDEFNYIEDLQSPAAESAAAAKEEAKTDAAGAKADTQAQLKELDGLLKIAEEKYADDTGFVNISAAGSYIKRVKSDFKIRPLGYSKLPEYLKDHPEKYVVEERSGKGNSKLILFKTVKPAPKKRTTKTRS